MQKTTIKIPDEELIEIDCLWKRHGFSSRSAFLRYSALHYEKAHQDELVLRHLAEAVFILHQIRRAQNGQLHILKKKDLKIIGALLSQIADRMTSLLGRP